MAEIGDVTVRVRLDFEPMIRAFSQMAEQSRRAGEQLMAFMRAADRHHRRHRTHVWETPARSAVHAEYRRKTRRRNRR